MRPLHFTPDIVAFVPKPRMDTKYPPRPSSDVKSLTLEERGQLTAILSEYLTQLASMHAEAHASKALGTIDLCAKWQTIAADLRDKLALG